MPIKLFTKARSIKKIFYFNEKQPEFWRPFSNSIYWLKNYGLRHDGRRHSFRSHEKKSRSTKFKIVFLNMKRYPLYLDIEGKRIPIVGGGETAARKARLIAKAGAKPVLIWPAIDDATKKDLGDRADYKERIPTLSDFSSAKIAVIASDEDTETAESWAKIARAAGALVNVVDQPDLCDFTTPSIIDRDALTIAIGTNGAAPVFGRNLRASIEALLPARIGALIDFAAGYRDRVKAARTPDARRAFWEAFFDGPIASLLLNGDEAAAHAAMDAALKSEIAAPEGVVHIVGAGPGDPDLLTLKAFRILQTADVILYDRLVSDQILDLARRDADRIFVGKAKANHAVPQADIEKKMVALAREGKTVVRLKGGDPFIFGRGGEELETLRAAGVNATVTPGVTAAAGCAAAAGMPLTHRDHAQAVTFVTGHAKGDEDPDLDWAALASLGNTLVVYMGVGKAGEITRNLIDHGRSAATPAAVIENGTRDNQIIAKGTLGDLPALIAAAGIVGPAILVIGDVAALADGASLQSLIQQERLVA